MLDRQELLTGVKVVLWVDSGEENINGATLEQRVEKALISPEQIDRFGGLSFGESSHLIDEVRRFDGDSTVEGRVFVLANLGQITLPIWVDHVGSEGTRYATGNLISGPLISPEVSKLPRIEPAEKIEKSGKPKKTIRS